MKCYIFLVFISLICFQYVRADEDYKNGRQFCKEVEKLEGGLRVKVPNSYTNDLKGSTDLYYWFLGKKFDPNKPTIVNVNGGPGGTSHYYPPIMDDISDLGYNVVFFDQRGYFCSRPEKFNIQSNASYYSLENTANDMEKIREAIGVEKWTIFGHSFGSPISLKYADLFSKRVNSIVIIGPAGIHINGFEGNERFEDNITADAISNLNLPTLCLNSEYKDMYKNLIVNFSNALGFQGINEINNRILEEGSSSEHVRSKIAYLSNELEEGDLFNDIYYKYQEQYSQEGKHVSLSKYDYPYEPSNTTELIVENPEFECIYNYDESKCHPGSSKYTATFLSNEIASSAPIYFFKGRFDGSFNKLLELNQAYKKKGINSTVVEFEQQGHGPLNEVRMFGSRKEKLTLLKMLDYAFKGEDIDAQIREFNSEGELSIRKR